MLRIALQSKGRLFEDCIDLLTEADIKVSSSKRVLLAKSGMTISHRALLWALPTSVS